MRINKFIAGATGLSRRAADTAIGDGRVLINDAPPSAGHDVSPEDIVMLDGVLLTLSPAKTTVLLNKPVGYVVSRDGQGSRTVYDLLPTELQTLKPVGRLDKNSSGLLLLTNDGDLANVLTHPSRQKVKRYEITLDQPLQPLHRQIIAERGVTLDDGVSKLGLERQKEDDDHAWMVTMHEGRNRQIRRTFDALGYEVIRLHRIQFGDYRLHDTPIGTYKTIH